MWSLSVMHQNLGCIVQCHAVWVKGVLYWGSLAARGDKKRGRISLISQCPQRPGHTAGHILQVCVQRTTYPLPFSEGYRQTTGLLRCLQELRKKASCPEPLGFRGPREVGSPFFRRMKPLVPWEARYSLFLWEKQEVPGYRGLLVQATQSKLPGSFFR